jgi:AraC-like DNA-binding protein
MVKLHAALRCLALAAVLVSASPAPAQEPAGCAGGPIPQSAVNLLSDGPGGPAHALLAEAYLDTSGTRTAPEIAALSFTPGGCDGAFAAPLPGQALWLRFTVQRPLMGGYHGAIAFGETIFDDVALYEHRGEFLELRAHSGRTLPPASRGGAMKTVLSLDLAPGEQRSYILRIAGTYAPVVTAIFGPEDALGTWSSLSMSMSALFLGFVAAIALVSVIIFRRIEARFFGYYGIYMACQFAFTFLYDGWFSQFLGSTLSVSVLVRALGFCSGLAVFANIQYCRILLAADADSRPRHWTLTGLSAAVVIATALAIADPWHLSLPLHLSYAGSPLVLLVICFLKLREGVPQAGPVFGSLLSLTLGLAVATYFSGAPTDITQARSAVGMLALSPLDWAFYLAILGEVTFMALAIAIMVNSMQQQRQAAVLEAKLLRDQARATANRHAEALRARGERIEALEARLIENPVRNLQAPVEQRFVQAATGCVIEHLGETGFGSRELAAALATSEKTLGRRLKEACGLSPAAFIRSIRLNFAHDLILMRQHGTVAEIAYAAGFSSVGHFAKLYRQQFGRTPSESFKSVKATG